MVRGALLRPRVVRPVHAVPRGHRLDLQDHPPDRGREGPQGGPRHDPGRRQARRQAPRSAPSTTARSARTSYIEKFREEFEALIPSATCLSSRSTARKSRSPAGTNLIEAARQARHPRSRTTAITPGSQIAGHCRLCMVDVEKNAAPADRLQHPGGRRDGGAHQDRARARDAGESIMEFHLVNHPLDCPVCDQAGECWLQIYYMQHGLYDPRMTRREGQQAEGGAARAPRHAGRGALHPVLALRALLRRDHRHRRARHLQPGRPLGDRPLPGQDARQQLLGQRDRHLPGGRPHRPGLPLPGARLVPRHRPSVCNGLRAGLQHRGAQRADGGRITTRAAASRASSRATTPTSTSGGCATRAATASAGSTTTAAS